ncbi:hypothetical protein FRC04_006020 [Tulasnella sp. 424]|nr:hypothetical protein FRC04_006020 [Tulasnella sp. 424]KAG8975609.1 hypothetical protein FRC05_005402 [Tulasnella sp. 425]
MATIVAQESVMALGLVLGSLLGGPQPYQPGYGPPQQQGQYYGAPPPGQYGQWQQQAPTGTQYPPYAYTGEPGTYGPPPGAPPPNGYVPDGPPTYPGPPQETTKPNHPTNV